MAEGKTERLTLCDIGPSQTYSVEWPPDAFHMPSFDS